MDCLVEVKDGFPFALVWLKRNIGFEICEIMLSDWEYTGKLKLTYKLLCMIFLNENIDPSKENESIYF